MNARRTHRCSHLDLCSAGIGFILITLASVSLSGAAGLPAFDFRNSGEARLWRAQHDVDLTGSGPDGLTAVLLGPDPYFSGPSRDFPSDLPLWLNLRMNSDAGGTCQVFYFREGTVPSERDSIRFAVNRGRWVTTRIRLPALGPQFHLRIDPPGETGKCQFERLWFEARVQHRAPEWPKPAFPEVREGDATINSGPLTLIHNRTQWGGFVIEVAGRRMAVGPGAARIGYASGDQARWWTLTDPRLAVATEQRTIVVSCADTDPDGGHWELRQSFSPGSNPGTLAVRTSVRSDQERALLYFPPLIWFAGVGTFGTNKEQALLAGVEYLENEPSSSEADLRGTQANRRVPDAAKLTFPLAAIVAEGRYLGLVWEPRPEVGVLFDSPDRLFGSGGHVVGLLLPGSDGVTRDEGSLVPYEPLKMEANRSLEVTAEILGGTGHDATAAVRHYARENDWPPVPVLAADSVRYFRLAARGWLDSRVREGDAFRHAVPGAFSPTPAGDAVCLMDWLAGTVNDPELEGRLRGAARSALARVEPGNRYDSGVGHVRYPVAALVYGGVEESARTALRRGREWLGGFEKGGTVRYHPQAGSLDYGQTHWTNEANGLTAQRVLSVLEVAAFTGDRSLTAEGLGHLRALEKFRGTVPRGAQTWEIPLHTPDILAAAHLVRAFVLGYELSGNVDDLDQARYWAWTGVPFVYLRAPTPEPVGLYATIPVLGATQWVAPNWIGLPVQWCGLVYAEALYRLARHDPDGPWRVLADGITGSGIQQTYPETDERYLGLLPDSFSLKAQQRNPANINPATLLIPAIQRFGDAPVYDAWSFPRHEIRVHAAGAIRERREDAEGIAFRVVGWPKGRHSVFLNGVYARPRVTIDGREVALALPHRWIPEQGWLILEVSGGAFFEVK